MVFNVFGYRIDVTKAYVKPNITIKCDTSAFRNDLIKIKNDIAKLEQERSKIETKYDAEVLKQTPHVSAGRNDNAAYHKAPSMTITKHDIDDLCGRIQEDNGLSASAVKIIKEFFVF